MVNLEGKEFHRADDELDKWRRRKSAELILAKEGEGRLREDDFKDIYPEQEVRSDQELVAVMKRKFEKDLDNLSEKEIARVDTGRKLSEALEIIVVGEGETYNWFGDGVFIVRTTEYDDIKNGVDAVLEIAPKEGEDLGRQTRRLALAIDASMKAEEFSIQRKFSRHKEYLIGKRPPLEVKYFCSVADKHKGKLIGLVPVVIGVEGGNVDQLIDLFAQLAALGDAPKGDKNARAIYQKKIKEAESHPVQVIFLEEIQDQLRHYLKILESLQDKAGDFYRAEIKRILDFVESTLEAKAKEGISAQTLRGDGVYQIIKELTAKAT